MLRKGVRDRTLNNRGAILMRFGSNVEAIICFDKMLEIDPTDQSALYNKKICLSNAKLD